MDFLLDFLMNVIGFAVGAWVLRLITFGRFDPTTRRVNFFLVALVGIVTVILGIWLAVLAVNFILGA